MVFSSIVNLDSLKVFICDSTEMVKILFSEGRIVNIGTHQMVSNVEDLSESIG